MTRVALVRTLGVVLVLVAACGSSEGDEDEAEVVATIELGDKAEPTALLWLGPERLLIGERLSGRILAVDPDAPVEWSVVATVDVDANAEGQRGLLGLAAVGDGLYAAWTRRSDDRLVVAQVAPGAQRLIWEGPAASDLAIGGHLSVDDDGAIIIGVGELQQPELVPDPSTPHGKLLALDPQGAADQRPAVRSGGWNNPFAFTVTGDGEIWVADNAPGECAERVGRGEVTEPLVELPGRRAPSALVALDAGRLGLCGFLDGDLVEVRIGGRPSVGNVLVEGMCRTGAAALGEDVIAVSDGDVVRVLRLTPAEAGG